MNNSTSRNSSKTQTDIPMRNFENGKVFDWKSLKNSKSASPTLRIPNTWAHFFNVIVSFNTKREKFIAPEKREKIYILMFDCSRGL